MTDVNFEYRYRMMQRYLDWTAADAERVAGLEPLVSPHFPELIQDFYAEVRRHPEAMRVTTGGSQQMVRLARTLRVWLAELLSGPYDQEYMARRWKVGYRHVEIGLEQRYASLALARLRVGIVRSIEAEWQGEPAQLRGVVASLHKLLDLEHALIQDAYEYEHVRRERLLERERSERRFRRLVENASCLIAILNDKYEILYFNPASQRTTGYTTEALRREPAKVLSLLGRSEQRAAERLAEVLRGSRDLAFEDLVQVQSGSPRWINWTLSRIDDFDEGPAVLAVGYDITDAKLAAEQLLQSSRLAAIGEMYAGLAHESRNALQRLRNCTDLLADEVADRPSALALVQRAQRAQEDVHRLLDEVKNYAAPIILERTDCRLQAMWREAWNLLHLPRRGRRARLVDDAADENVTISADRFRMVQAFRNLLENSLIACEDPVVIRVETAKTIQDGIPSVAVYIEDNGPGFSEDALERAFEPFFTTKSSGTGLGLAIVSRIVEAHGGRAMASAASCGGARVTLMLPLTAPALAHGGTPQELEPQVE